MKWDINDLFFIDDENEVSYDFQNEIKKKPFCVESYFNLIEYIISLDIEHMTHEINGNYLMINTNHYPVNDFIVSLLASRPESKLFFQGMKDGINQYFYKPDDISIYANAKRITVSHG